MEAGIEQATSNPKNIQSKTAIFCKNTNKKNFFQLLILMKDIKNLKNIKLKQEEYYLECLNDYMNRIKNTTNY